MPNLVPGSTRSCPETDLQRRTDRRLIADVLRLGCVTLPTDCPDLAPLIERIDALDSAEQTFA